MPRTAVGICYATRNTCLNLVGKRTPNPCVFVEDAEEDAANHCVFVEDAEEDAKTIVILWKTLTGRRTMI